jgi:hypothetical protein
MTFTFPRLSAGIYEIQKDSNTVGFIRKASASKWIVADVVDTPQHVAKTLKEAKDAVVNLIIFNTSSQEVDETPETEYNDSVEVDKVNESLNNKVQGVLNCYKQVEGTNEFVKVSPTEFGFAEPTLDPIMF